MNPASPASQPLGPSRPGQRANGYAIALLVAVTVLAYVNSFGGVFLLDDHRSLEENETIRHLWPLTIPLSPPSPSTVSGRPIANLTFALNGVLHGRNVFGYHLVNLAIHLGAGLTLFGLIRRTLILPRMPARLHANAAPIALITAALWLVHPLQTEAVTYIVQRVESLMGLFYLLTLYGYLRAATSPRGHGWAALALGACFLGMATKEVMASAPLMGLLYDRTFLSGSFREAVRQRGRLLLGLAAGWLIVGALVVSTGGNRGGSAGFGTEVSAWSYWLTQPRALVTYLKLWLWPHPLVFEYGSDWLKSSLAALPPALIVAPLLVATVVALWRWPAFGFLGAWFFCILSPTLVMPSLRQTTVEHRMYLSLAAVLVLAVALGYALLGRRRTMLLGAIVLAFATLTARRNDDYRDAIGMWRDTLRKKPANALAHDNLGGALQAAGRLDEALPHHQIATELAPENVEVRYNYGTALLDAGRPEEALAQLSVAVRLAPEHPAAHNNLSIALAALGRLDDSVREAALAVRYDPGNASFHYNLGTSLLALGRPADAAAAFEAALRLKPTYVDAHNDLGNALVQQGELEEAIREFREALRLRPNDVQVHHNLGTAFAIMGRMTDARREFEEALRLDPQYAPSREALARVQAATRQP